MGVETLEVQAEGRHLRPLFRHVPLAVLKEGWLKVADGIGRIDAILLQES